MVRASNEASSNNHRRYDYLVKVSSRSKKWKSLSKRDIVISLVWVTNHATVGIDEDNDIAFLVIKDWYEHFIADIFGIIFYRAVVAASTEGRRAKKTV